MRKIDEVLNGKIVEVRDRMTGRRVVKFNQLKAAVRYIQKYDSYGTLELWYRNKKLKNIEEME